MTATGYRVAFATYAGAPDITADDQVLADALAGDGIEASGVPWDAPVDWTTYDAVLLRSTWDFHLRLPAFMEWLQRLDADCVQVVNAGRLVRWNVTKRYLEELMAEGVAIVPTRWVASSHQSEVTSLASVAAKSGWNSGIVVKPVVSASAHDTWVARGLGAEAEDERFRLSLSQSSHGLMLQPFIPEIRTQGEWSLVFIAGAYSHAVLKTPAAGDFRVQRDYGGSAEAAEPPAALIEDASQVVRAAARVTDQLPRDILYARVDGVERAGRLLLMEFEAVEPVLFLRAAPAAGARMAAALKQLIAGRVAVAESVGLTPGCNPGR